MIEKKRLRNSSPSPAAAPTLGLAGKKRKASEMVTKPQKIKGSKPEKKRAASPPVFEPRSTRRSTAKK